MMQNQYDIIILGAGITGLTCALALADHTSLRIALCDTTPFNPSWQADHFATRVSAITRASQRIFNSLHIWPTLSAKRVTPFRHMRVWDAAGTGRIEFHHTELAEPDLGFIIENPVMQDTLLERVMHTASIACIAPFHAQDVSVHTDKVVLTSTTKQTLQAKVLIGADGARSWLREHLAFPLYEHDYQQHGLVATVQSEQPHRHTAYQRFLQQTTLMNTHGTLAFLPLADPHTSSIVWSMDAVACEHLLAMPESDFCQTLAQHFEHHLGEIVSVHGRAAFPLRLRHAKHYVQPRIALIGDAAHSIHPLAGQGLNLGLLDAASLAEVIVKAHQRGRDMGALPVLQQYQRWRKGHNAVLAHAMTGFKTLFAPSNGMLAWARNKGLSLVNRAGPGKRFFANYALGLTGDLPNRARYNAGQIASSRDDASW